MAYVLPESEGGVVLNADIQVVARATLHEAEHLVPVWLPNGRREGHEWVARNPTRHDAHLGSFKVNLDTGVWCDFATGDKGSDLMSLYAYLNHLRRGEAARELADQLGIAGRQTHGNGERKGQRRTSKDSANHWRPLIPVPPDAPQPPQAHPKHSRPSMTWTYRDPAGNVLCHVYRFDFPDRQKEILPLTYRRRDNGELAWRWKGLPAPKPLYNLHLLSSHPDATVIVCEGEKAADACAQLFQVPKFVATTSLNGAQSPDKTDWSPLAVRTVWIWPDHDAPGQKYLHAVAQQVPQASLYEINLEWLAKVLGKDSLPESYDAADAVSDRLTLDQIHEALEEYARACEDHHNAPETPDLDTARAKASEFMALPDRNNRLPDLLDQEHLAWLHVLRGGDLDSFAKLRLTVGKVRFRDIEAAIDRFEAARRHEAERRAYERQTRLNACLLKPYLPPLDGLQEEAKAKPEQLHTYPYLVKEGSICRIKETRDGPVKYPLCNFDARIVEEVLRDDGAEVSCYFLIEGSLANGRPLPRAEVPTSAFPTLNWVTANWGNAPVVYAGQSSECSTA